MSLDVYLILEGQKQVHMGNRIFIREDGQTKEISREEWDTRYPGREPIEVILPIEDDTVFSWNITHNLNTMAEKAEIYKFLWRPEELGITTAKDLIIPLALGLTLLKLDPERFKQYNPSNGWGTYETLVKFVESYLEACDKYPEAKIRVSR